MHKAFFYFYKVRNSLVLGKWVWQSYLEQECPHRTQPRCTTLSPLEWKWHCKCVHFVEIFGGALSHHCAPHTHWCHPAPRFDSSLESIHSSSWTEHRGPYLHMLASRQVCEITFIWTDLVVLQWMNLHQLSRMMCWMTRNIKILACLLGIRD